MPVLDHNDAQGSTQRCLLGKIQPPVCARNSVWADARCLRSHVRSWQIPYARVLDCFRCCLLNTLERTGLAANRPFWHERMMAHSVTREFLEKIWMDMRRQNYSWRKLYFPYWLDRFLSSASHRLEDGEF